MGTLCLPARAGAKTLPGKRVSPNVLLINCDDLGWAEVGCYGSLWATPNIDRLAANGVRFTSFYSGNAFSSPSRAALLTGCYAMRTGIREVLFPRQDTGLNPDEFTMAEMFRNAGYATACVGRFFLQEMTGRIIPKFNDKNWIPGVIIASTVFTFAWGYLAYTGNISSIWPLFGMSNQLLAACALIVCTTMLLRMNKGKYALCTAIPGLFMVFITFWAGFIQISSIYIPKGQYLLATLGITALLLMTFVFVGAFRKWRKLIKIKTTVTDQFGEQVKERIEE